MKYIKAKSVIEVNKALGFKDLFWAKDYYDRAIRNEMHFDTVYKYICDNPVKAGLYDANERIYSIYE